MGETTLDTFVLEVTDLHEAVWAKEVLFWTSPFLVEVIRPVIASALAGGAVEAYTGLLAEVKACKNVFDVLNYAMAGLCTKLTRI